jgi:hypothetical protein
MHNLSVILYIGLASMNSVFFTCEHTLQGFSSKSLCFSKKEVMPTPTQTKMLSCQAEVERSINQEGTMTQGGNNHGRM